jgi:NADH-quinone oxidoreductase subunit J
VDFSSITLNDIFFFVFASVSIASGVMVITRRNPVTSALYLVLNFFALGGIYLTLNAQFIAVIQVLVYAGAIMVLFLFVIMLLNLGDEERLAEKISYAKMIGVGLSVGVFLEIVYIVGFSTGALPRGDLSNGAQIGTIEEIGTVLFTSYLFPVEIVAILLLAAVIGAVILAKKTID